MAGRILTATLHAVGILLYYLGAAAIIRYLGRRNAKVLLYHDCAPAETSYTAGLDCTTSPQVFAKHLEYLQRHYSVVALDIIVAGKALPTSVAITFDDGYRSVFEHALPLLVERSFPATLYLISDVIGNDDMVWVNELNHWLRTYPERTSELVQVFFAKAPASPAEQVISFCRINFNAATMETLIGALRTEFNYSPAKQAREAKLYVGWNEIVLLGEGGFSFGNHTRSHPNLERLTRSEQVAEIAGAQKALTEHLTEVRSLAYPFGHHSRESAEIAAEIGLQSVAEVGGYNLPVDPLAIGRVHLSDQSVAGLFARMEVVEPVKGALRRALKRQSR
jgi:peptidoglycan/xylan/chitin deacetylase (PgdA/CDA1 family)